MIIAAGALLFLPFLGSVHLFDWDEINFAECAREMIVTGDYSRVQIDFQPFWEKPPLFIWMQALSMNMFGVGEFAARLPNAICGIVTLLLVFSIGKRTFDERFGFLWALAFAGSFLPHFYFKSGIIDPWFNLFIFCGIYYFILFSNNENASENNSTNNKRLLLSALFIGLGIMTKGPVALLVFILCLLAYAAIKRFRSPAIRWRQALLFFLAVGLCGGMWFIVEALRGRFDVIMEFINYQLRLLRTEDSGHGGPFFYHFVILLIGCFPASILALRAFGKNDADTPFQKHFKVWMIILLVIVLLLFSLVKTKIVHYSSLCYFPLSWLAAYSIYRIINRELGWRPWMTGLLVFIGLSIAAAITALPLVNFWKEQLISSGLVHDDFALSNLQAEVHWAGYEWIIGAMFAACLLIGTYFIMGRRYRRALLWIFTGSLVTVNIASAVLVPKVEQYSQGAAIEFYEKHSGKDIPVETLGFKSYAHLFYTDKRPHVPVEGEHTHYVTKVDPAEEDILREKKGLTEIYRKNGFIFWDNAGSCFLH